MNKAAIIIDDTLPLGYLANAVACITSGLFLKGNELVGNSIQGQNIEFIPITKIPILILKPAKRSMNEILKEVQKVDIKYMAFTLEAQSTTDYETYIQRVKGKGLDEVKLIGLGIVGPVKLVNSLVGSLPMLR